MEGQDRYAVMLADYKQVAFYLVYAAGEAEALRKAKESWVEDGGEELAEAQIQKAGNVRVEKLFKWELP